MKEENLNHLSAMYRLALEHARYRDACRFAIRGLRRNRDDRMWAARLRGSFTRRHRR